MSSINSLDGGLIVPSFTFGLNQSIIPGCVCSGRFGGTLLQSSSSSSSSSFQTANSLLPTSPTNSSNASLGVDIVTLACATSGGRIVLHDGATSQNINNTYNSNIRYLNINRSISALTCARLPTPSSSSSTGRNDTTGGVTNGYATGSSSGYSSSLVSISSGPQVNPLSLTTDVLLIGTSGSIQAYNVDTNTDLFFKDTSEAVTAVISGNWSMINNDDLGIPSNTNSGNTRKLSGSSISAVEKSVPLCISGGNCTLTGYDVDGNERLWGVTGDVVTSLAMADVDGKYSILVKKRKR